MIGAICAVTLGVGVTSSLAQSASEMASASIARDFYADVQRRISASTRSGESYYFSQRYEMTPEIAAANEARRRDDVIMEGLRKDPVFMRYLNGYWDHYQARSTAKPGEFCAATYVNLDGSVTLSGVDKSWGGGLLMFIGKDIPQPREFREISVTLTQDNDPPATVKVFNLPSSSQLAGAGTLIFAVPSMGAALSGMENEQQFVISHEGKEIYRMTWKNGLQARNTLRHCTRRR